MKIYLDDERSTPEGWVRCFNVGELINHFLNEDKNDLITDVSLDNDLGEGISEGYLFLNWLEEKIHYDPTMRVPNVHIHSANPVARERMQRTLEAIERRKSSKNSGTD